MPNGDPSPALLLGKSDAPNIISQSELGDAQKLEAAALASRAKLHAKLLAGFPIEAGPLRADAAALARPIPRGILTSAVPSPPTPTPRLKLDSAEESHPDGGLTFTELRQLRDFQVLGRFQPAVLRSIVNRLDTLIDSKLAASRERMAARGSFTIGNWLRLRVLSAYRVWRLRRLIRLHELGFTQFKEYIVAGILEVNREYFAAALIPYP